MRLQRQDEIGQLGAAFEDMRVRLRDSLGAGLQLEQNRKELLAHISHDLKTPITAIQGCVECLQGGVADTEEKRQKYVSMIGGKTADMNRMIEELLLYSTLDIGGLPFHFERLEMGDYLRQIVDELRLDPRMNGVQADFIDFARQPLYVEADREKLQRAIQNIVDNSLKYMTGEPRLIRFELSRTEDGSIAIRVTDNGTGIPEEALPYVFDRFFRAEASRRADAGSSGLGLAIVKQIADEHGGTVRASRAAVGTGTTVAIHLPPAPDPSQQKGAPL